MNTYTDAELAKAARELQRTGMTAAGAAEYLGTDVDRLERIGGVMVPVLTTRTTRDGYTRDVYEQGCGRCGKDFHQCECFKVGASDFTITPGRYDDR